MTAFRPDSDEPTAYEALGGNQPPFTREYIEAIGLHGLRLVNPRLAAQADASTYYQQEFGLSGDIGDKDAETLEAMHATVEGLREGTLPGMANDPDRPKEPEPKLTPEEEGEELVRKAHEAWPEL